MSFLRLVILIYLLSVSYFASAKSFFWGVVIPDGLRDHGPRCIPMYLEKGYPARFSLCEFIGYFGGDDYVSLDLVEGMDFDFGSANVYVVRISGEFGFFVAHQDECDSINFKMGMSKEEVQDLWKPHPQ